MAKVKGPLLSVSASGSIGPLTYQTRSSCAAVAIKPLKTTKREATLAQLHTRNAILVSASLCAWLTKLLTKYPGATERDKLRLQRASKAKRRWNTTYGKVIGQSAGQWLVNKLADYDALPTNTKAVWNDAAPGTPPGLIFPTDPISTYRTQQISNGAMFYVHICALTELGLGTLTPESPPLYA